MEVIVVNNNNTVKWDKEALSKILEECGMPVMVMKTWYGEEVYVQGPNYGIELKVINKNE